MVRSNASEAIVWKVSAFDRIVSGYEPLDMDTLEAISKRIGRYPKSYGRRLARPFSAEEFRKAWEKCLKRSE